MIKEFDREIKDEGARNSEEVNKQLNDEKQSMVNTHNSFFFLAYVGNLGPTSSKFGRGARFFVYCELTFRITLFLMSNNFINIFHIVKASNKVISIWSEKSSSVWGSSICVLYFACRCPCTQTTNSLWLITYVFLADQGAKLICGTEKNVSSSIYFLYCF